LITMAQRNWRYHLLKGNNKDSNGIQVICNNMIWGHGYEPTTVPVPINAQCIPTNAKVRSNKGPGFMLAAYSLGKNETQTDRDKNTRCPLLMLEWKEHLKILDIYIDIYHDYSLFDVTLIRGPLVIFISLFYIPLDLLPIKTVTQGRTNFYTIKEQLV
jgi:hypothetical protein